MRSKQKLIDTIRAVPISGRTYEQIEEMAKDFCALDMPCEECHLYKNRCHAKKYATRAYNAGYRKVVEQSETARECQEGVDNGFSSSVTESVTRADVARGIFEEIAKIIQHHDELAERDKSEYGELIVMDIGCAIAELKKKYTEEITEGGE